MQGFQRNLSRLFPLGWGALLGMTMVFPQFWPLSAVAIGGGIHVLERSESMRAALARAYLFGLGFCAVSLSFLLLAYPTDWLGIGDKTIGALLVFGTWTLCSLPVPLSIVPWGMAVHILRKEHFGIRVVVGALVWVACEYLRSLFAALILWMPGLPLGPHIAFTLTGLAASGSGGLLWFAYFGGFWALAGVTYVFAAFLHEGWSAWRVRNSRRATVFVAPILCAYVLAALVPPALQTVIGASSATVDGVSVALVHTDFSRTSGLSPEEREHKARVLAAAITKAAAQLKQGGLIVLPEDSRLFELSAYLPESERTNVEVSLSRADAVLVDSGRLPDWDGAYSVVEVRYPSTSTPPMRIYKTLLAAFGEYMPSVFALPLELAGFRSTLDAHEALRGYNPAPRAFNPDEHTFVFGDTAFGILSCSEVLSTRLYPMFGEGVDVLLNISSLSSGQGSPIMFNQFLAMAKIHAAVARKPYLQATNFEPNIIIIPRISSTDIAL